MPLCSTAFLIYVYLPVCRSITCQFLGRCGLFGDRWWSALHLNGDPGGEARPGGREQLLIGQGVSPCHYAVSAARLLHQCHSVSRSVARRRGPWRCKRLVLLTVGHFWGRVREDLDLSASSLPVALWSWRCCRHGSFSLARPLLAVNFVSYHQDDNKNQHRGDNNPSNDNNHGASQEVAVQCLALAELCVRGERQTAQRTSCCQWGDDIIKHGQDTEIVVASSGEIPNQEVIAAGWNHPAKNKRHRENMSSKLKTLNKAIPDF